MSLALRLAPLRSHAGTVRTRGLADDVLERFAATHPALSQAVDAALEAYDAARAELAELLELDEAEQLRRVQAGFLNFYADDAVNPYVALAARGPWVVTLKGAVVYDCGGYGMLGFGHTPPEVLRALARPQAMANIMTPSLAHLRLDRALRAELGHTRGGCPYAKFLALNSGSEAVSLAGRIADVNAKLQTDPGGRHAGKTVMRLAVKGAFHGRTELPALYSDSSRKTYLEHLASHQRLGAHLVTVEPYSLDELREAFARADREGWFFEAMFLEPVMGEGDPGRAVPPEFYAEARRLTEEHGTLLLVDSIQAGLRAHGVLSIVDYPGFEGLAPPDFETYSKALNAAQFPMSILAVSERAAGLYRRGTYGNTMTANPRAMDVAAATLALLTPAVRENIRARGAEFLARLRALQAELPAGAITRVQGTGLLFSCEIASHFKCYGSDSIEEYLRQQGVNVIHGGVNSLRFTPVFTVTSAEVELVVAAVRDALLHGPRRA